MTLEDQGGLNITSCLGGPSPPAAPLINKNSVAWGEVGEGILSAWPIPYIPPLPFWPELQGKNGTQVCVGCWLLAILPLATSTANKCLLSPVLIWQPQVAAGPQSKGCYRLTDPAPGSPSTHSLSSYVTFHKRPNTKSRGAEVRESFSFLQFSAKGH